MTVTPQPSGSNVYIVMLQIMDRVAQQAEIANLLSEKKITLDWWFEQPFFERSEKALADLALYFDANVVAIEDYGKTKMQRLRVQYDVYLEFVSTADPAYSSPSKAAFTSFIPAQIAIHRALHGWKAAGGSSSLVRSAGPTPVAGAARMGKLLLQTFTCHVEDETAMPEVTSTIIQNILLQSVTALP